MDVIKQEEVTHTHCDVCGKDITHASQQGPATTRLGDESKFNYVVCMNRKFDVELDKGITNRRPQRGVSLSCRVFAEFYIDYPAMANSTWIKALEANTGKVK